MTASKRASAAKPGTASGVTYAVDAGAVSYTHLIDLGLKDFATLSTGQKIENKRPYRALQAKLGIAQRAHKRRQVTAIHTKIVNQRTDFLHKEALKLVKTFDYIAVGNINAAALAKTRLAKSVLDAGWSSFRHLLRYKAIERGAWFEDVDERMSTRVCSTCGRASGPKGVADLGIRDWVCSCLLYTSRCV